MDTKWLMKKCNSCGRTKGISKFYRDKHQKDGYKTICTACEKIRKQKQLTKICGKCKKIKYHIEFHKNPTHQDGLQAWCKECQNKHLRRIGNITKKKKKTSINIEPQQLPLVEKINTPASGILSWQAIDTLKILKSLFEDASFLMITKSKTGAISIKTDSGIERKSYMSASCQKKELSNIQKLQECMDKLYESKPIFVEVERYGSEGIKPIEEEKINCYFKSEGSCISSSGMSICGGYEGHKELYNKIYTICTFTKNADIKLCSWNESMREQYAFLAENRKKEKQGD